LAQAANSDGDNLFAGRVVRLVAIDQRHERVERDAAAAPAIEDLEHRPLSLRQVEVGDAAAVMVKPRRRQALGGSRELRPAILAKRHPLAGRPLRLERSVRLDLAEPAPLRDATSRDVAKRVVALAIDGTRARGRTALQRRPVGRVERVAATALAERFSHREAPVLSVLSVLSVARARSLQAGD